MEHTVVNALQCVAFVRPSYLYSLFRYFMTVYRFLFHLAFGLNINWYVPKEIWF